MMVHREKLGFFQLDSCSVVNNEHHVMELTGKSIQLLLLIVYGELENYNHCLIILFILVEQYGRFKLKIRITVSIGLGMLILITKLRSLRYLLHIGAPPVIQSLTMTTTINNNHVLTCKYIPLSFNVHGGRISNYYME
jgi:hypothetical protein